MSVVCCSCSVYVICVMCVECFGFYVVSMVFDERVVIGVRVVCVVCIGSVLCVVLCRIVLCFAVVLLCFLY